MADQDKVPTLKWVESSFTQGPDGMSPEEVLAWISSTSKPTIIDTEEEGSDEQR